ncbi:pepsin/retropepsin-like aspartic protease family protein [uncultured Alistipes sp.]|jgi:hypothetical protein|uniref:pepsin/retropepsin-like aspartic protease family protein n=1 Tax=uncultured Alistipes sp. TaxID=538949 RepID=UPI0025F708D7|nr:pepsin/retropepsin-like aspartic protease family protein [uncultured Alistipes sp.]
MKKLLLLITAFGTMTVNNLHAQDRKACEKIVRATVNAINDQSPESLDKYLAPDFSCSGQKGRMATVVLKQLVGQLGEHVASIKKTDASQRGDELTLVYEFDYTVKLGKRNTTFVFNKDNQLKQLDLLTVQVKKLDSETGTVENGDEDVVVVPIKRHKKLITAEALVDGVKRTFLIDNGAPRLILNSKYTAVADTSSLKLSNSKGVNSSISGMDITKIGEFDFHGIKIKDKEVLAVDLSHLEGDTQIYGLLGYEVYKDYDMLLDYADNTLTLIKPEATDGYIKQLTDAGSIEVPLEMVRHIACIEAQVGGRTLRLGIDCGAETNLLNEALFDSVKTNVSALEEHDLSGADRTVKKVRGGKIDNLTIGSADFTDADCVFNDISHLNASLGKHIDGLIGYDILSRQKTLLSYRNQKFIILN